MRIRCPECRFERTIDIDQIPSTATVATCPKCGNRFRFRDPETGQAVFNGPDGPDGEASAAPERPRDPVVPVDRGYPDHQEDAAASSAPRGDERRDAPHLPTEQEGDDPLPPGAVIPRFGREDDEPVPGKPAPGDPVPGESAPKAEAARNEGGVLDRWQKRLDAAKEKAAGELSPPEHTGDVPWEHPERYGFFGSLYHTIVRVLFHAPEFFRSVRGVAPLGRPVIFYVLLSFFNTLVSRLWLIGPLRELSENAVSPQAQAMAESFSQTLSIPMLVLLVPFIALFQLFIQGALYHLMIRLVQPDRADFNVTLRVVAYSAAPYVFCVVPMAGAWVGTLWFAAASFVGCKYALGLDWTKTVLALAPLFLLELAFMLQASAMLASMF